jgi:hypothetical protein
MCRYLSSRLASSSTIAGAMLSRLRSVVLLTLMPILLDRYGRGRARELVASAVFHSRPYDVASQGLVAPRVATMRRVVFLELLPHRRRRSSSLMPLTPVWMKRLRASRFARRTTDSIIARELCSISRYRNWACLVPNVVRLKECFHRRGNLCSVCLYREMSGIEEFNLRVRQVFPKRLCSSRNEERIIPAPNGK